MSTIVLPAPRFCPLLFLFLLTVPGVVYSHNAVSSGSIYREEQERLPGLRIAVQKEIRHVVKKLGPRLGAIYYSSKVASASCGYLVAESSLSLGGIVWSIKFHCSTVAPSLRDTCYVTPTTIPATS